MQAPWMVEALAHTRATRTRPGADLPVPPPVMDWDAFNAFHAAACEALDDGWAGEGLLDPLDPNDSGAPSCLAALHQAGYASVMLGQRLVDAGWDRAAVAIHVPDVARLHRWETTTDEGRDRAGWSFSIKPTAQDFERLVSVLRWHPARQVWDVPPALNELMPFKYHELSEWLDAVGQTWERWVDAGACSVDLLQQRVDATFHWPYVALRPEQRIAGTPWLNTLMGAPTGERILRCQALGVAPADWLKAADPMQIGLASDGPDALYTFVISVIAQGNHASLAALETVGFDWAHIDGRAVALGTREHFYRQRPSKAAPFLEDLLQRGATWRGTEATTLMGLMSVVLHSAAGEDQTALQHLMHALMTHPIEGPRFQGALHQVNTEASLNTIISFYTHSLGHSSSISPDNFRAAVDFLVQWHAPLNAVLAKPLLNHPPMFQMVHTSPIDDPMGVQVLLDAGIDPNPRMEQGNNRPLALAIERGYVGMATTLILGGAPTESVAFPPHLLEPLREAVRERFARVAALKLAPTARSRPRM